MWRDRLIEEGRERGKKRAKERDSS